MDRLLARAQHVLLALAFTYMGVLVLLTTPFFQRHAIFMHTLRWPPFADFTKPEKYSLPVHRSSHVFVDTRDGERLGAWILLPDVPTCRASDGIIPADSLSNDTIKSSVSSRPTIIYLHGNAASRAASYRVPQVTAFSNQFSANVLSIDYRGFGDSSGSPSQDGLLNDARAAWNWVMERGGRPDQTLLVGISLGSAVATELGASLSSEGVSPKGVVLLAPFSTLESLLDDYHIFGIIPILQPLQPLPFLSKFLKRFLKYNYDSISTIQKIDAPIVIAHSKDDFEIPIRHSEKLFSTLLEPLLPPEPSIPSKISELSKLDWPAHQRIVAERDAQREQHVQSQVIEKFGTISRFRRTNGHDVVFVESKYGGHGRIGIQGTVIDVLGAIFDLP